jgi:uncharacterized protein (TIGR03546 family)
MNFLKEIWNSFKRTVKGFDTPRQLALGVTFGMLIGLVPKDSLFPYALGIIAMLSTGNLLCVAVSAVAFSWLSPMLDPVSHQMGAWVLTFDPFESTWAALYQMPFVPWTRFDNTVVTGSLLLGLMLTVPVYSISFRCFEKFGSPIFKAVSSSRAARWLIGNPAPNPQKS